MLKYGEGRVRDAEGMFVSSDKLTITVRWSGLHRQLPPSTRQSASNNLTLPLISLFNINTHRTKLTQYSDWGIDNLL